MLSVISIVYDLWDCVFKADISFYWRQISYIRTSFNYHQNQIGNADPYAKNESYHNTKFTVVCGSCGCRYAYNKSRKIAGLWHFVLLNIKPRSHRTPKSRTRSRKIAGLWRFVLLNIKPRSHRTSKSRTRSYENLVDVVVSGNFWSTLAWPCFVTGYGRRRLFHGWSTA